MAFGSRWPHWLKMKNPDAPAVKREAEEDWGKGKRHGKIGSKSSP